MITCNLVFNYKNDWPLFMMTAWENIYHCSSIILETTQLSLHLIIIIYLPFISNSVSNRYFAILKYHCSRWLGIPSNLIIQNTQVTENGMLPQARCKILVDAGMIYKLIMHFLIKIPFSLSCQNLVLVSPSQQQVLKFPLDLKPNEFKNGQFK